MRNGYLAGQPLMHTSETCHQHIIGILYTRVTVSVNFLYPDLSTKKDLDIKKSKILGNKHLKKGRGVLKKIKKKNPNKKK